MVFLQILKVLLLNVINIVLLILYYIEDLVHALIWKLFIMKPVVIRSHKLWTLKLELWTSQIWSSNNLTISCYCILFERYVLSYFREKYNKRSTAPLKPSNVCFNLLWGSQQCYKLLLWQNCLQDAVCGKCFDKCLPNLYI